MKQLNKIKSISTDIIFYLAILFFIIGFNFSDNMAGGWYQQFMPNLGGRNITDVFFLDSLTGWAVTNIINQNPDTAYVLKTSDGGNNWMTIYKEILAGGGVYGLNRIYFLNANTGYMCGLDHSPTRGFKKTTDWGLSWLDLNVPVTAENYLDMSILNEDTQWLLTPNPLTGGVYRTTNGGLNWDRQLDLGSQNPSKIYMYNARIGFVSSTAGLYKTTNSGLNWFNISNDFSFSDMFFIDSLTGWKASGFMKKTTNGGLNWINQTLPSGGNIIVTSIEKFTNVNNDTIFGVSGYASTGSGARGMIYRTTNGGNNWLFQIPDSNINIFRYLHSKFINKINGWAYNPVTGIHTTTGGEPIFYTSIKQISSTVPDNFKLFQNYPNPFNPSTNIRYEVRSQRSEVRLVVYDINGREILTLVNKKQNAGVYEVTFNGSNLSSGIYFYSLFADGNLIETKRMVLIK